MQAKLLVGSIILAFVAIYSSEKIKLFLTTTISSLVSVAPEEDTKIVSKPATKLFTVEELSQYNGKDRPELYLAILGKVFDVSKGADKYAPGSGYNFFIGKDASRSFVTGEFQGQAQDDVMDLTQEDLKSLNQWVDFYGKEYRRVGKVIGRYYKENGKLTPYGKQVKKLIRMAEEFKLKKAEEQALFPPCNIEWDPERGTRLWCTNKSGGKQREWVGVPRQLYEAGSTSPRCACINDRDLNLGNVKAYDGCDRDSRECYVKTL